MMSLRKVVAVAFMLVAAGTQVRGAGWWRRWRRRGGGRGGWRRQQMQRMRELLFADITLDEAQTKQVDSIMTATAAKRTEMMQAARSGGGDRQAMMEQMQAVQTEERKAHPRPAKRRAADGLRQECRDHAGPGRPARPPPAVGVGRSRCRTRSLRATAAGGHGSRGGRWPPRVLAPFPCRARSGGKIDGRSLPGHSCRRCLPRRPPCTDPRRPHAR